MKFYSATWLETAPFMQGGEIQVVRSPEQMNEHGVLVLWGGEDINPRIYNHRRHVSTGPASSRDDLELALVHHAIDNGMPIVGVCRGAQMLCAVAGGSLIQDVRGHAGSNHFILEMDSGQLTPVNSIHHQQMYLQQMPKDHYKVLATAAVHDDGGLVGQGHIWTGDGDLVVEYEPESVWFPKIKGLAFQWHPEYLSDEHPSQEFVERMFKKYITKEFVNESV